MTIIKNTLSIGPQEYLDPLLKLRNLSVPKNPNEHYEVHCHCINLTPKSFLPGVPIAVTPFQV